MAAGRTISATVIADSVAPHGARITTVEATFPRFLLAELNTHRAFSRNSASSRAMPAARMIQEVREDPFIPSHWTTERPGMSGGEEFTDPVAIEQLRFTWELALEVAVLRAEQLASAMVHKSLVNRLLEPFMWHTAVVTATEWDNFFAQRLALLDDGRPAAEPHFYELASCMRDALTGSLPLPSGPDNMLDWHMPYITGADLAAVARGDIEPHQLPKLSVARCAGVSYGNQAKKREYDRDLALYARLRDAKPPHWSPFEHVASVADTADFRADNLRGWTSLRWQLNARDDKCVFTTR